MIHNQDELRNHEAKYHNYQSSKYEPHYPRLLSKEEKIAIVAKGEKRLGWHHFFGYGTESTRLPNFFKPVISDVDISYYHGPHESMK